MKLRKKAQSLRGLDLFDFVTMMALSYKDEPEVQRKSRLEDKAEAAVEKALNYWKRTEGRNIPGNFILDEHFDRRSRQNAIRSVVREWKDEEEMEDSVFEQQYRPRSQLQRLSSLDKAILRIACKNSFIRQELIGTLKKAVKVHPLKELKPLVKKLEKEVASFKTKKVTEKDIKRLMDMWRPLPSQIIKTPPGKESKLKREMKKSVDESLKEIFRLEKTLKKASSVKTASSESDQITRLLMEAFNRGIETGVESYENYGKNLRRLISQFKNSLKDPSLANSSISSYLVDLFFLKGRLSSTYFPEEYLPSVKDLTSKVRVILTSCSGQKDSRLMKLENSRDHLLKYIFDELDNLDWTPASGPEVVAKNLSKQICALVGFLN